MKIRDFEDYFNLNYPDEVSFDWDNSGVLVSSDKETEVTKVVTCLDVTFSVIEKAIELGAQLIVSHHPLIFNPLKKITQDSVVSRKIISLIENNISLISLHTRFDFNFDGLNRTVAELIGIEIKDSVFPENEKYTKIIGKLKRTFSPVELAEHISKTLKTPVKLYSADMSIQNIAICCGAGKDYFEFARNCGVDAFITGDLTHHTVVDSLEEGITLIDFGHFGSEKIFSELMRSDIERHFPDIEVFDFNEDFTGICIDVN